MNKFTRLPVNRTHLKTQISRSCRPRAAPAFQTRQKINKNPWNLILFVRLQKQSYFPRFQTVRVPTWKAIVYVLCLPGNTKLLLEN